MGVRWKPPVRIGPERRRNPAAPRGGAVIYVVTDDVTVLETTWHRLIGSAIGPCDNRLFGPVRRC
ncbi:hypothetical protein ACVWZD_008000 [Streptomyces sp. TE3672]